jgi:hypothetical protein
MSFSDLDQISSFRLSVSKILGRGNNVRAHHVFSRRKIAASVVLWALVALELGLPGIIELSLERKPYDADKRRSEQGA